VIPTVGGVDRLETCLGSFARHHGPDREIIVVDDGGSPRDRPALDELCRRHDARCVHEPQNRGFSRSVNRGVALATGELILLVNDDVCFTAPVIGPMEAVFDARPAVGIVGGLLRFPDGRIQHGGMEYRRGVFGHRGHGASASGFLETDGARYVIGCTAALLGVRSAVLRDIGPFDERLPLTFEDVEFCLRAWHRGWRVWYTPAVQAIHREGGTRGRSLSMRIARGFFLRELTSVLRFRSVIRPLDPERIEAAVRQANGERRRPPSRRSSTGVAER
jgi:GT2 family glycosyltransferase